MELFGVRADAGKGAKALQDQAQGSVVGDGMLVDGAPAHAPDVFYLFLQKQNRSRAPYIP
jgi:hypothetical protein